MSHSISVTSRPSTCNTFLSIFTPMVVWYLSVYWLCTNRATRLVLPTPYDPSIQIFFLTMPVFRVYRGATTTLTDLSNPDILQPVDPESLLPLPQAAFHIMVALAASERHGYAMMQEVADGTEGKLRLGPGTLYGSIKRMLEDGLIAEHEPRAAAGDERRRYYRLTAFGRRVASAETARLESLYKQARAAGLAVKR